MEFTSHILPSNDIRSGQPQFKNWVSIKRSFDDPSISANLRSDDVLTSRREQVKPSSFDTAKAKGRLAPLLPDRSKRPAKAIGQSVLPSQPTERFIESSPPDVQLHSPKNINILRTPSQVLPVVNFRKFSIADFEMGAKLGKGRFGDVFLARERRTNFIIALKILNKIEIQRLNAERPIVREIKIHSFTDHPSIIKLYGFFHDDENIYLILEYAPDGEVYKELKDSVG